MASESGAASMTPAAQVASGPGGAPPLPPLLGDSATADLLATAAAAAGIRRPPAARKSLDDEPGVEPAAPPADVPGKPGRESAAAAEAEPGPAGRSVPERDPAGRFKAASGPGSTRKSGPDSPPKGEAESRPRGRADSDSTLRRKAESAWMDVAADLAARRGTPVGRAARRDSDVGPAGLRRADDPGPAKLRRGGEAEPAWKDDESKSPTDEDGQAEAPARLAESAERSGPRDDGDASDGRPRPGDETMPVPAFEPFGPPAKAGPGRLRRPKKGPPGETA